MPVWRATAAFVLVALACGHPAPPPPLVPVAGAAPAPDSCVLSADSTRSPDTLTVAVPDVAGFVQRQLYESLLRVDCRGTAVPGLAQSWTGDDGGRRWTFMLRAGARFSDGTPVTGADVFAALARDSSLLDGATVSLEGIDRVSVRWTDTRTSAPLELGDPSLGVTRRSASTSWLIGSGVATADSAAGAATVRPVSAGGGRPSIALRSSGGADGRDLLDHGIDLLVTGDPEVLSYATGRGNLTTIALPWDRVYVLVTTSATSISDSVRASLARDVVRTTARPAHGSAWWVAAPACAMSDSAPVPSAASGSHTSPVVYYLRDDAPARDLAERLVALGLAGTGGRSAAVGAGDFEVLFAAGGASFILPLPRVALSPCRAVADLLARAPWLSPDPARHITALVETRPHAIVRHGGSAFTVDWDGTLRLR